MKSLKGSRIFAIAVLSALLVAFDHLLAPGALLGWNPSPLWLLVLMIAMRHGSPAGMFAGLAASVIHVWGLVGSGYPIQDILHLYPEMLAVPVLYVLVGLFLGETRERLGRRADAFAATIDRLGKQLDSSEIKRMEVERGHLEMEKRIAGQTDTLRNVYDNLNRLAGARSESELWELTVGLMTAEMHAHSCAVWEVHPPRVLAHTGPMPEELPPLVRIAVRRKGMATAADWPQGTGRTPPGAELAGVLVPDPENPTVLAVSGMSFNRLNRNTSILFDLMTQRAGGVATEIRRLDRLRRATVDDPEFGLSSENYLRNRVREQTMLSRRHGGELTLIACAAMKSHGRVLDERLAVVLASAMRAASRASDGIAFFPGRKAFVALLPGANPAGGAVVVGKVMKNLALLDLRAADGSPLLELRWGISGFDAGQGEEAMYERLFRFDAGEEGG